MTDESVILGVDFSGARADKSTWVTQGALEHGALTIRSCQPMTRAELAALLASLPGSAIAALDFPFSVPRQFADHWLPGATVMPELWAAAATMDFEEFMSMGDCFVAKHGEPLRWGDLYFPECYSCFHKFNPNMVPMTFRGMQMLDRLWLAGCNVPPLPGEKRTGPLLLESMPGAALKAYALPYKGYKNGRRAGELRQAILDGLETRSSVPVTNLDLFRDSCIVSHDCLDSVAAAVTACLWAKDHTVFRLPQNEPGDPSRRRGTPEPLKNELATARLEGWLYAPVFLNQMASKST